MDYMLEELEEQNHVCYFITKQSSLTCR